MTEQLSAQTVLDGLKRLLDREALSYLSLARQRGHGVQIMLNVQPDGKIGAPKITVDTRGDTRVR